MSATKETEGSAVVTPPLEDDKAVPKRTPGKRRSFIERAQIESEQLVRNLGGTLELEGGRRTRSSARGGVARESPALTPPVTKRARKSPAAQQQTAPKATGRGRGRKQQATAESPVSSEISTEETSTVTESTPKEQAQTTTEAEQSTASKPDDKAEPLKSIPEKEEKELNKSVEEPTKPTELKQNSATVTPMEVDDEPAAEPSAEKETTSVPAINTTPLTTEAVSAAVNEESSDAAEASSTSLSKAALVIDEQQTSSSTSENRDVADIVEVDSSSKSDDVEFVQDSDIAEVVADESVAAPVAEEVKTPEPAVVATKIVLNDVVEKKNPDNGIANNIGEEAAATSCTNNTNASASHIVNPEQQVESTKTSSGLSGAELNATATAPEVQN